MLNKFYTKQSLVNSILYKTKTIWNKFLELWTVSLLLILFMRFLYLNIIQLISLKLTNFREWCGNLFIVVAVAGAAVAEISWK